MQSAAAAGVNAVIASILVAGLALYGAQVFGELAVLRRRIAASMNRVNDLANSSPVDADDPDAAENDGRAMYSRLNRLRSLTLGMPIDGLGSDPKSRGNELQRIIRGLHSHYPFATQLIPRPGGLPPMVGRQQFAFSDYEMAGQWVRDATYLRNEVRYTVAEHAGTLRTLLEAVRPPDYPVAALDDSIFARTAPVSPLATLEELAAQPFPAEADMFVIDVFGLGRIADETSKLLDEREGYVKGTPWRSAFIGLALLSLVALTCGAIIPMLFPGVSSVVYLWVPSAIYVLAGLAGIGGAIASFRR